MDSYQYEFSLKTRFFATNLYVIHAVLSLIECGNGLFCPPSKYIAINLWCSAWCPRMLGTQLRGPGIQFPGRARWIFSLLIADIQCLYLPNQWIKYIVLIDSCDVPSCEVNCGNPLKCSSPCIRLFVAGFKGQWDMSTAAMCSFGICPCLIT